MSSNAVFLYQNYGDGAVLTDGAWRAGLPLANLQSPDIRKVVRSLSPLAASTRFLANLGTAQPVGGIALGPTNLSPGASYRIRAFSDAGLTALVLDTGTKTVAGLTVDSLDLEWEDPGFWYGIPGAIEVADEPVWLVDIFPEDRAAPFWLVEIFDEGNAQGFIEIGRLMLGRAWRPCVNYDYGGNSFSIEPLTDAEESLGGSTFFWRRGHRRVWRCSFGMLGEEEAFEDVYRMMSVLGIDRQLFVVPDPDDLLNLRKRAFLGTFKEIPAIQQVLFRMGATAFDIKEVL